MGTYVGYYGDMVIPEERRSEFTERVLQILHQGGMMQMEKVSLFGKNLPLLAPIAANEEGLVYCTYNYFEDDGWEPAGYHMNAASFFSDKVGSNEFNAVIRTVYVLYEFYTEKFGLAWENETPFNASPHIRWLNDLFDETYTNERAMDLWEAYQLLPTHRKQADLFQLLDMDEISATSVTGALKYVVLTGKQSLEQLVESMSDEEVPKHEVTLLGCVKALLGVLKRIRESGEGGYREKLENLKRILTEEDLKNHQESKWADYQLVSLLSVLPPREITVKSIADVFGIGYEETMEDLGPLIHDKSELWDQRRMPMKPLPPLDTTSFLMQTHRGSAGAMSDDTAYRITDDDRAYYWRKEGDVRFSEGMCAWLRELRCEWEMIQTEEPRMDAMALIVSQLRNICDYNEKVTQEKKWDFSDAPKLYRIKGSTLGMIGCGQIPRRVAVMAKGFGMNLVGYDPYLSREIADQYGIRMVDTIEELAGEADAILSHVPLMPSTEKMVGRNLFDNVKKNPIFVNTARGGTVDHVALCEALRDGRIRAAGLDVVDSEPADFNSEIFRCDNVIFTPHAAFYSETALEEVRRRSAHNVVDFMAGDLDKVNFVVKPA